MALQSAAETGKCPYSGAAGGSHHGGYEPFDMKNPFPAYAEMRKEEPVMFDERVGYGVVTRYDDIKAVFEDGGGPSPRRIRRRRCANADRRPRRS